MGDRSIVQTCLDRENMRKKIESEKEIAQQLSDMIVYCQAVKFKKERLAVLQEKGFNYREMSSLNETKATGLFFKNWEFFKTYHKVN